MPNPHVRAAGEAMPAATLINTDGTFNRSAIFAAAWERARMDAAVTGRLFRYHAFGFYLRKAWASARSLRDFVRDGSAERERQEQARRLAARTAFITSLDPARLAAIDEATAIRCSTDSRLSNEALARLAELRA